MGALSTATLTGAAEAPVGLGAADSFAVLAGTGVTNTGASIINGDLGTCPTPAITGFPPGVVNGAIHAGDAVCLQAQSDLTIAYNDAAGRVPTTTFPAPTDLGGLTLMPGVYKSPSSFAITGTLTLDAQGDPSAVFIFQAGSTLITSPNSQVALINGAQACNVFWQVGSSATLGVGSTFVGTILALTSITANTNARVTGRVLARNGAVTLDSNTITNACATGPTTTTSTTSTTSTTAPTTTSTTAPTTTSTTAPTTSTTAPTTSTTGPTTSTTGPTTSTTTAVPVTTTTAAPTTSTTGPTTTSTTRGDGSVTGTTSGGPGGEALSAPSAAVPKAKEIRTLALTGSSALSEVLAAAVAIAMGCLMVVLARREPRARRP
ncbi:MAG: ice-binding family protein [Acidimicrobiales bacterium]